MERLGQQRERRGKHEVLEPDEAMTSEWTITIEKV